MEKHPIVDLMTNTMQKIREMVDVDTIIGNAISTPDGTTIIPVSRVSFGFGSGGGDIKGKQEDKRFGGGGAAGVKIVPVAFLIVTDGNIKLLPVSPPAGNTIDRAIEMVPTAIDKIADLFKKGKKEEGDV